MKNPELRILLVFSDRSEAKLIKRRFEEASMNKIWTSHSYSEAMQVLESRKIDLVVSERELPGKDGLELLKAMGSHQSLFLIPFIMITVENRKHKIMEAVYAGVSGYLLRPYSFATLQDKVFKVLGARSAFTEKMNKVQEAQDLTEKGLFDEAIQSFEEAVQDHDEPELFCALGYRHMAEGRYDEAINAFRKAIELNHLYAEAYRGLGEAYLKKGDIESAEKYLIKAGQLFIQRTQFHEARTSLLLALQVNPMSVNPYNTLGIVYRKSGQFDKAIQSYQMALGLSPNDAAVHYNMARAYIEASRTQEAVTCLHKSIELNPNFQEALKLRDLLLSESRGSDPERHAMILDRYRVLEETHRGARSVLTAADIQTERKVRIVRYDISPTRYPLADRNKLDEIWSRLLKAGRDPHPLLPAVYDTAREDEALILVEEWLDAQSIEELSGQGKQVPARMAMEVAVKAASALGHLHACGVLHLAMNPARILITQQRQVKVTGYGLFELEAELDAASRDMRRGVSPYFAPEHFSGMPFSPATDVFSLGAIVYEMLTREHPFHHKIPSTIMYNICFSDAPPFTHSNEPFAEAMRVVFHQALSKDPVRRFSDGYELERALTQAARLL